MNRLFFLLSLSLFVNPQVVFSEDTEMEETIVTAASSLQKKMGGIGSGTLLQMKQLQSIRRVARCLLAQLQLKKVSC